MGAAFEEACRVFAAHGGRLPFRPVRVGEWWDRNSDNQIDVVALGGAGELVASECKWGSVAARDLETLKQRVQLLLSELTGVRTVHFALFSGRGFDAAVRWRLHAEGATLFTLEDLFPAN